MSWSYYAKFERNVPIDVEVTTRWNFKIIFLEYREYLLGSLPIIRTCRDAPKSWHARSRSRCNQWLYTWAGMKQTISVKFCISWRMKEECGEEKESERGRDDCGPFVDCIRSSCEGTRLPLRRVLGHCSVRRLIMHRSCAPWRDALSPPHLFHSPR